ncbi:beta-lactamase domain-containing protein [Janthinobacterium sp. HH01]|uniref:MBL fold metallo-hydrolase n=1 Tax=Janthinobacterium sp. HH01 TaxID=1198452 RepID=UPI0002AEBBF6|nr:MBL fold metallo-hydrolase [Janthinobacterium sp. HH01]ELX11535.1 beta-lactamase domain-containing protein [Janthinobacterium sp. HH01]
MNLLESQLDYPLGDTIPAAGAVHEIVPGLRWLRMPLPFALDHINLWLLRDGDGWSAVDSGVAGDATRAAWETIFETGLDGLALRRVFATHCHPDHIGLADWLCQRWDAPLWTTTGEYAFARMMSAALPGVDGPAALPHFQRHGLRDPDMLEKMAGRKNYYPTLVPSVPTAYTRIQDGQLVVIGDHQWQVITGFGHAPEHASLYCAALNVLIAGDMVLPRISTNVSVFAVEPESNPLTLYLDSLAKFVDLPNDVLVLPSHGKPFHGLHTRIAQLQQHHVERLAEVVEACGDWQSAADIVPLMFKRPLDAHQLGFALGEALAHLHKLWHDGIVRRETGADGIIRFRLK